jgi:hypothetical protein
VPIPNRSPITAETTIRPIRGNLEVALLYLFISSSEAESFGTLLSMILWAMVKLMKDINAPTRVKKTASSILARRTEDQTPERCTDLNHRKSVKKTDMPRRESTKTIRTMKTPSATT